MKRKPVRVHLQTMPESRHEIPPGRVAVHDEEGLGFYWWHQEPDPELEVCSCGFAPGLGVHYRGPYWPVRKVKVLAWMAAYKKEG